MKTLKKLVDVMAKNVGITWVLVLAIMFFIWSCRWNLFHGLITAFAALIIYVSATMLYQEFKKSSKSKKDVISKNIGITLVLILAIIFFIWSCHGNLFHGLITALAALIAYVSASMLYHEFKKPSKTKKK